MSEIYISRVFTDTTTNESQVVASCVRNDKFYIVKKITDEINESVKKELESSIKQKIKDNDYFTLTQMIKYFLQ